MDMFINIGGVLLIVTIICHTQTVEKPMRDTIETTPNPDGHITISRRQESSKSTKKKQWKFEDYLKKFEPSTIWEQIDKQKKYNGLILSDEQQSEIMLRAMDPTDEIMALKIENGDPKLAKPYKEGRRASSAFFSSFADPGGWKPPKSRGYEIDKFFLRNRLYELMKQAIYTTRNKMVIMQIYREKYINSSLYKMGFLFNKADNAAKTFGKYSFRAYRACLLARDKLQYRLPVYDLMATNERQLNLWFNVELLADLIEANDIIVKQVFSNYTLNRMEQLDKHFID